MTEIYTVGTVHNFDGELAPITRVQDLPANGLVLVYGAGAIEADGEGSLLLDVISYADLDA